MNKLKQSFSKKSGGTRRVVPRWDFIKDTSSGAVAKARKFFEENPFTWEMLEELRKGNSVRVDAGRKDRRSS